LPSSLLQAVILPSSRFHAVMYPSTETLFVVELGQGGTLSAQGLQSGMQLCAKSAPFSTPHSVAMAAGVIARTRHSGCRMS